MEQRHAILSYTGEERRMNWRGEKNVIKRRLRLPAALASEYLALGFVESISRKSANRSGMCN